MNENVVRTSLGTVVRDSDKSELVSRGNLLETVADVVDAAYFVPSGEMNVELLSDEVIDLLWAGGSVYWEAVDSKVVFSRFREEGAQVVEATFAEAQPLEVLVNALNEATKLSGRRLANAVAWS